MLLTAWTPEQWAIVIPILGLQVIGVITAWRQGGRATATAATAAATAATAAVTAEEVSDKVDAVHHELRPPSNGTTTGALQEFIAGWIPWLYEEVRLIGEKLDVDQHEPPPTLPQVKPPTRPDDRRRDKHK